MEAVKQLDRLLVCLVCLVVAAAAADALHGHGHGTGSVSAPRHAAAAARGPAPVPDLVRLVPSDTAFLRNCPARALALAVGPGPELVLRYRGRPCHVPPLRLQATATDLSSVVVYRGPALAHEDLSGNYAGEGVARGRLLVPCPAGRLRVRVFGSGLAARGTVAC